jgi:hypothetical protein
VPRADPFRDTDVIDSRAPRANQAIVATMAALGLVLDLPVLWALMSLQLVIGLVLGRQWCLPCLAYFKLIQPRIGEGELEDARAPRLANMIGAFLLGAAWLASVVGSEAVGQVLAAIVAVLAALAATTGLCLGCELYRIQARLRGISGQRIDRVDPADFGGWRGRALLAFTHPLCSECQQLEERFSGSGLIEIDVSERPEIARRYRVSYVPTVVEVAEDGGVLRRLLP